jgi:hypothetical protein
MAQSASKLELMLSCRYCRCVPRIRAKSADGSVTKFSFARYSGSVHGAPQLTTREIWSEILRRKRWGTWAVSEIVRTFLQILVEFLPTFEIWFWCCRETLVRLSYHHGLAFGRKPQKSSEKLHLALFRGDFARRFATLALFSKWNHMFTGKERVLLWQCSACSTPLFY